MSLDPVGRELKVKKLNGKSESQVKLKLTSANLTVENKKWRKI